MFTLRLTQYADSQPNFFRIEVALEGDGPRQTAEVRFQFKLTQQEQENIRWYLEDYLQYLSDPAPQIAVRVEKKMVEIGVELFKAIFQANDDARDLWATLRQNLSRTRVEILTDVAHATAIPWELLRDPKTDTCLAWRSPAFVRSYSQPAQRPQLPQATGDAIRILLVICRPQGGEDVPFRSVASRLIKGLGTRPDGFQLDVLRPPTFEQLGRVLRQAKAQGKPYHVVHFDGHGVYQNSNQLALNTNPLMFVDHRPGMHGYLAFENGMTDENVEFISGSDLGQLLVETNVPVLVLNACRSAHAEPQDAPAQIDETSEQVADLHTRVRSFGSLAQEVMDAGVAGVVAMRYNVYVITAAQFVANLYASLVQGQTLGEAVTSGRKQLKDQPLREVAFKPVPLQDWLVPVVYEAAPIALFPSSVYSNKLTITLHENDALPAMGALDTQLPKTPDAGFFGRDETLLAIDRAFDHHAIALLHAFAGSGKTSVAAELGRWYALTGGLLESGRQGHVLFTSFQRYLPLTRVLDKLGQVFERDLERSGIHWLALSDEQRRAVALQVLSQVPVLWIWDNVEPIAGFPDGESQRWSEAEQQELADFLRDARNTKAKFLLTSRRDERVWLGNLPVRVQVPPMPMQERVQLARALAEKHGHRLTDVGNWLPLLKFTQGNPLTITVVVSQSLQNGYRSKEQIERFVAELRSGEAKLDDEDGNGFTALSTSISYGFRNLFNEWERKQLILLSFFQEVIDVDMFCMLSQRRVKQSKTSAGELIREKGLEILNRAATMGILTAFGGGHYAIHPVLPFYLQNLISNSYLNPDEKQQGSLVESFANAIESVCRFYSIQYQQGNRSYITLLKAHENNLIHAMRLAHANNHLEEYADILYCLTQLYVHTGERLSWQRVVDEIWKHYVGSNINNASSEEETIWRLLVFSKGWLAQSEGDLPEAEQWYGYLVQKYRQKAIPILSMQLNERNNEQTSVLSNLAAYLSELAKVQRKQNKASCVKNYQEAFEIGIQIKQKDICHTCALGLGSSYKNISDVRDLEQSIHWYKYSIEMANENDFLSISRSISQIGMVFYEYFIDAKDTNCSADELEHYLSEAKKYLYQGLQLTPQDAIDELAIGYSQLGNLYGMSDSINNALSFFREAIRCFEANKNFYNSAGVRYNIAAILFNTERYDESMLYAQSAFQIYSTYGDRASSEKQLVQKLISNIEEKSQN